MKCIFYNEHFSYTEGWRSRTGSVVRVTVVSQHRHLVSHARDVYQSALSIIVICQCHLLFFNLELLLITILNHQLRRYRESFILSLEHHRITNLSLSIDKRCRGMSCRPPIGTATAPILFFSREDTSTGGSRHTLLLCQKGRPAGEEVPLQRSLS